MYNIMRVSTIIVVFGEANIILYRLTITRYYEYRTTKFFVSNFHFWKISRLK